MTTKQNIEEIATIIDLRLKDNEAIIKFENVNTDIINKLRIWFLKDLPTYSIEKVAIYSNSGAYIDEEVCRALGDVPLSNDVSENLLLQLLVPCPAGVEKTEDEKYCYELNENFNENSDEQCQIITNQHLISLKDPNFREIEAMLKGSKKKSLVLTALKKDQNIRLRCRIQRGAPWKQSKWLGLANASLKQDDKKESTVYFYLYGNEKLKCTTLLWLVQWHFGSELKLGPGISIDKTRTPWTINLYNHKNYFEPLFKSYREEKIKRKAYIDKVTRLTLDRKNSLETDTGSSYEEIYSDSDSNTESYEDVPNDDEEKSTDSNNDNGETVGHERDNGKTVGHRSDNDKSSDEEERSNELKEKEQLQQELDEEDSQESNEQSLSIRDNGQGSSVDSIDNDELEADRLEKLIEEDDVEIVDAGNEDDGSESVSNEQGSSVNSIDNEQGSSVNSIDNEQGSSVGYTDNDDSNNYRTEASRYDDAEYKESEIIEEELSEIDE